MMSIETMKQISRKAARESRARGEQPFFPSAFELEPGELEKIHNMIPFLGDRTPRGWRMVDMTTHGNHGWQGGAELFVDLTGFGDESEPAMTQRALLAKMRELGPGYGYYLSEVGQFQGFVRVVQPVGGAR